MDTQFAITGLMAGVLLALFAMPAPAQAGPSIPEDNHAAVIFAYHRVGEDENPSASIRQEQFENHISELTDGDYTVMKLDDIVHAFENGDDLPPRTVALTFDGAHASFLTSALPVLEEHNLPYTLFVVPGRAKNDDGRSIGWEKLRELEKSGLATIGLHPAFYTRLADAPESEIRRQTNSAISQYREQMGHEPVVFAYPFGEYSKTYRDIIEASGFSAAVGQQSGVAYDASDRFALPRFSLTERYGDTDRFQMLARALPLPVTAIEPLNPEISAQDAVIGFTVSDTLHGALRNLACYASGQRRPTLETLGNRVELRLKDMVTSARVRINCTLPGPQGAPEDPPIWRWFGLLLSVPENQDTATSDEEEDLDGAESAETVHEGHSVQ